MQVKVVRMRDKGVEHDRRVLGHLPGHRGMLVIMDVSDQGLRRLTKVARLIQGGDIRHELVDVHILWAHDGKFVLTGFERHPKSVSDFLCGWGREIIPKGKFHDRCNDHEKTEEAKST